MPLLYIKFLSLATNFRAQSIIWKCFLGRSANSHTIQVSLCSDCSLTRCVAGVEGSQCDYLPLKLLLKALVTRHEQQKPCAVVRGPHSHKHSTTC